MSLRNNIVTIVALMLGAMTPSPSMGSDLHPKMCCSINTDADSFCNAPICDVYLGTSARFDAGDYVVEHRVYRRIHYWVKIDKWRLS